MDSEKTKSYSAGGIKIWNQETESRKQKQERKRNTEHGIRERRFQEIDLEKIYISNDNKKK